MGKRHVWVVCVALGWLIVSPLGGCRTPSVENNGNSLRITIADAPKDADLSVLERKQEKFSPDSSADDNLILNAVVTDSCGEIVAQGKLAALTVTAVHRNIAERNGKIRICFDMHVSEALLSDNRQVRIMPKLIMDGDTMFLDRVLTTGKLYRQAQIKGYERYNKYYSTIIPDSVDFIKAFGYLDLLDNFSRRNLGGREEGEFGITGQEALDHYVKNYLVRLNKRRKDKLDEVFSKCVKDPIDRLGIRLDTVLENPSGGLVYRYVQDLKATPQMHRMRMVFLGSIHLYGKTISTFESPDTLTWYVSSLTQMADTNAFYRKQALARDVAVSTLAFIEFSKGSWVIDTTLGNNAYELNRILCEFDSLSSSKTFATDSVIISASCSPEGNYSTNRTLSRKRAEAVTEYFSFLSSQSGTKIKLRTEHIPENWDLLKSHIVTDVNIKKKDAVLSVFSEDNYDKREELLSRLSDYKYIREKLYPLLRRIDFTFLLHRRVYDTVETEFIPDQTYKEGLDALMHRDFKKALSLLRPYSDINTAIAYLCLNYNASALAVLSGLEKTPKADYLTAMVYVRMGDRVKAMEHYRRAIEGDDRLRFRSALDPEMEPFLEEVGLYD